jgi:hypothetical protein
MTRELGLLALLLVLAPGCAEMRARAGGRPPDATAGAPEADGRAWRVYSSVAGRFGVLAPGRPKESKEILRTAAGVPVETSTILWEGDSRSFMIQYVDYPTEASLNLDSARDGAVQAIKGRLAREEIISLAGFPGRDLTIESPASVFRTRLYLVGRRLYTVVAADAREAGRTAELERFVGSFQLSAP